jgi:hypothetical protein
MRALKCKIICIRGMNKAHKLQILFILNAEHEMSVTLMRYLKICSLVSLRCVNISSMKCDAHLIFTGFFLQDFEGEA